MLQNYLTTFVRVLLRQKTYSLINVVGLSLGIAAFTFIALYISDELSFDRFHRDAERIYRVTIEGVVPGGGEFNSVKIAYPVAEVMQNEIPAVESTLRMKFQMAGIFPVRYEEKNFTTRKLIFVDSNFFHFFDFKLLVGNKSKLLDGPGKVVVAESMARKLFDVKGNDFRNVVGKIIQVDDNPVISAIVTGVAADPPFNSHFHFEILCSMDSFEDARKYTSWTNINGVCTYFKLRPHTQLSSVDSTYAVFMEKYMAADWERVFKTPWAEFKRKGAVAVFKNQRLTDIHLNSNLKNEVEPNGKLLYIYLFGAIGALIIALACVNFTNLSTARASTRAKEIGIRKTVGAIKRRLVTQFLFESFLYTSMSVVVGLALVSAFLTPFNELSGKLISIDRLWQPSVAIATILITCIVAILAGGHPAFLLSSFKPASVLKGNLQSISRGVGMRKALVIFQFCISLSLVIGTLVIYEQLKFIQSKALGFDKENVLRINNAYELHDKTEVFKTELLKDAGISNASYSIQIPPDIREAYGVLALGANVEEHIASVHLIDYDHLQTFGFQMAKGRFFSRDFPSDSTAIILNETAAKDIGWQDFEGKKIFSPAISDFDTFHVIGIIKDFHFQGLQVPIKPLVMTLIHKDDITRMAIRLGKGDAQKKISYIEGLWKKLAPEAQLEYSFLDEDFDAQYRSERRLEKVFLTFTVLAIVIACLGLFGLAAFTAEQRTKEIGIRKVMGASVRQVAILLSKDFVRLMAIALVIAVPISWYWMERWLHGFAYRINFDFVVVVITGLVGLALTVLTVSYQSVKAAMGNPVENLRSE